MVGAGDVRMGCYNLRREEEEEGKEEAGASERARAGGIDGHSRDLRT